MQTQIFEFKVMNVGSRRQSGHIRGQNQYFSEKLAEKLTLEMVTIPEGQFLMGSPQSDSQAYDQEKPQHLVTVKPFFMSKYLITQAQWQAVAALSPVHLPLPLQPSKYLDRSRPVEQISWYQAVEFCARLSQPSGRQYRLPSEAEWEYACRAGTTTPFYFGKKLPLDLVNCHGSTLKGKAIEGTTPVGAFEVANGFGLYDMCGNVYEWCWDDWHDDYEGAPSDGSAWLGGNQPLEKLIRGGFWRDYPKHCRCAYRTSLEAERKSSLVGLRVVCEFMT